MLNCINDYNGDSTKYFSWGDIIGQNKNDSGSYSFSQANYNAGACGSGHNLSSDIPQGDARYDASRANMGSQWKMFTKDQGQELIDGTNHIWTDVNNVDGIKFISKTDSTKYIFLPTSGYWNNYPSINPNNVGQIGAYWSTTWYANDIQTLLFFNNKVTDLTPSVHTSTRYLGYSVRGVR